MSDRSIEKLHIVFQPMVKSLLEQGQTAISSTMWKFFITDGFRSMAEQTALYAQGRTKAGKIVTNAKAGQSPHNFGLAVDMAFQKDGALSYSPDLYAKIYPIAKKLGFELGAEWSGFTDKPHFEHPKWEIISKGENMPTDLEACMTDRKKFWAERDEALAKIVLLEIDKKSLEEDVRELNFELEKLKNSPVVVPVDPSVKWKLNGKTESFDKDGVHIEINYAIDESK